jgi:hypothetical protein
MPSVGAIVDLRGGRQRADQEGAAHRNL